MKKLILSTLYSLLLMNFTYAGIGENFEPAGIRIAGGGSFSFSLPELKNTDEYYLSASLSPSFGIMTIRNLELGIGVGYHFFHSKHDNDWETNFNTISLGTSLQYFFVKNPENSKGIVNSLGIQLSGYLYIDRYHNWPESQKDENNLGFSVSPFYSLYFFVTERIAHYLSVRPTLGTSYRDYDELSFNVYFVFGISFHFPRKMRVTHKLKD